MGQPAASNQLKIGILTGDIESLKNWEFRIINEILNHPGLELTLFIKDGRTGANSFGDTLKRNIFAGKVLSNIIFALQLKIESKLFKAKDTVDKNSIKDKISDIDTVYLSPTRKGSLDIFSKDDADKIKKYDLDIILRHEFNTIRGDILNSSKYGVWDIRCADNAIYRGGPAGFWEIVNNEPCCGVTLLSNGLVIDKAYYNLHWSFYRTANNLSESSVALLFKNINKVLRTRELNAKKPLTYYHKLYEKPTMKYLFIYLFKFYLNVCRSIFNRILPVRTFCWNIFFGEGLFLESSLYKIKPQKLPKNVFWADPFLYSYKDDLYVFFENYSYKTKRGKISVGKIVNGTVCEVEDVLDFDYHLSYPNIIEEDGALFLIPETSGNRRLEVYRCIDFPNKWELYSTKFEGEEIADITYFQDENKERWLFLNRGFIDHNAELYIYKIDNLKLENIESHILNPVFIDCRKGRNGGAIFKFENSYCRPSQINIQGIYGRGLQISRIKKLTLNEYEEEPVISIEPNFIKGLCGIHHLHQIRGNFIFDGCFKRYV
ncbi:hypothetical protein AGMMS49587_04110 [Spirochaetia bacterium]|nr:hypothetical protein AGMMS49587_04110 [Spirochaetia bacterium]